MPIDVFETMELYILSFPTSTGHGWILRETFGSHTGQFPRTNVVDFGLADARGEFLGGIVSNFASHHAPNVTRPKQTMQARGLFVERKK